MTFGDGTSESADSLFKFAATLIADRVEYNHSSGIEYTVDSDEHFGESSAVPTDEYRVRRRINREIRLEKISDNTCYVRGTVATGVEA